MQDIKGDGVVVGNQTNNGPTQNIVGDHANVSNYNFDFDAFISAFFGVISAVALLASLTYLVVRFRMRREQKNIPPLAWEIIRTAYETQLPIRLLTTRGGSDLFIDGVYRFNGYRERKEALAETVSYLLRYEYVIEDKEKKDDPSDRTFELSKRSKRLCRATLKSDAPRR